MSNMCAYNTIFASIHTKRDKINHITLKTKSAVVLLSRERNSVEN